MGAAGERAADPIEHAAAGFVYGRRREIAETRACQVPAQRLGQGDGVGAEILVHRKAIRRALPPRPAEPGIAVRGTAADGGGQVIPRFIEVSVEIP